MAVDTPPKKGSRWLIVLAAVFAVIVVLVAVATIAAFTWLDVSLSDGVGDHSYTPAAVSDVHREYALGVGNLTLDLSRLATGDRAEVDAHVGIGKLRVIVPAGASVAVDARVKAGSISALGRTDDGRNARVRTVGGKLDLKARVGAGRIEVVSR
jgi:Cell wall-active antibiotics response 4TMS YvqF